MWTREIINMEVLQLLECFILYSVIGWAVESIYMSICNHELTNRGFGVGPFCPIYGFGAVMGYILLHPLHNNVVLLYFVGALTATVFEYIVAKLMQRFLHEVWWDYNNKPFNYQGVICLESTIAWGFYAIIVVKWLHGLVMHVTALVPVNVGKVACFVILFSYLLDFFYHVLVALDIDIRENVKEKKEVVVEKYQSFRNRFW